MASEVTLVVEAGVEIEKLFKCLYLFLSIVEFNLNKRSMRKNNLISIRLDKYSWQHITCTPSVPVKQNSQPPS